MPFYRDCSACHDQVIWMKFSTMSWVVILLIIIAVVALYNIMLDKKDRRRVYQHRETFRSIRVSQQQKIDEDMGRLQPVDEHLAQRIKKLLYSATYHENRNVVAFHNVLKEMSGLNKEILLNGGTERMSRIVDRVEYLCGNEKVAFTDLLSIMRRTYLPVGATT